MHARPPARRRRTGAMVAIVAALACLISMLAAGLAAAPTSAAPASIAAQKIRPKLATQLDSRDQTDFWVYFDASADLAAASRIKDWDARGTAVAQALKKIANDSQRAVRADLDAAGVTYQSFWAVNAIKVTDGDQQLAEQLAGRATVDSLWPSFKVDPPKLDKSTVKHQVNSLEWGVANIKANDVWADYGVRGEGITVASIDTGVQYDHPALVNSYRGNNHDGTFNHNYNWYDASGTCPGVPCDTAGHGTHTMGTMVGDDGADNQIGVAPGAKWIAANGCCPSDAALISSGQWMLQPTDLNGQNPDASKRPNIVNNSWGSELPSNEPFLEDITLAWAASGIFGVWSNGNTGPSCESSGSPGSLASNYSVGAYDVDNSIASFSSRGVGQNGVIKPNISAPGVGVRSSVPGSGYASYDGTSMAAPHVSGTVALVWSAAPALIGDIEGTRALLDQTATDTPDGQCGGTDGDNNVYGEGRLDALTLVQQAPIGVTGWVGGSITDESGSPIAGANVTISGPVDRQLKSNADGTYRSGTLPIGTYTITADKYGYRANSGEVQIEDGATAQLDLALADQPLSVVSGTVRDGSGHGWPLYAKIVVDGYPGGAIFTDPKTGKYSVTLANDAPYTMHVYPEYDGYLSADQTFTLGTTDLVRNVGLRVDPTTCGALGYRWNGTNQGFSGWPATVARSGWKVSGKPGWRFDNPGSRSTPLGGAGGFAVADSARNSSKRMSTTLTSPRYNLKGHKRPQLTFDTAYHPKGTKPIARIGLSVNGGRKWTTIWRAGTRAVAGQVNVALRRAANKPNVRVRFHYEGRNAWWWALDDVFVGTHTCVPKPGGLVVGFVTDHDTNETVFAKISRVGAAGEFGAGVKTPLDPTIGDGLYWAFSSQAGSVKFNATAPGYLARQAAVTVRRNAVVARDWSLYRR